MAVYDEEPEILYLQSADETLYKKNRRKLKRQGYTLNAQRENTLRDVNWKLVDVAHEYINAAFQWQNRSTKGK